ncbi:cilia- and flagella-associated protein 251-like isoform X1 [Rhinatrema bivittatum]|uniref:cilia- and flagella-associated protein 251-like isoform X1 n=1 Tax=Rhinatrema bivittatum TaxID=194408 RepID=UPI001128AA10|nr:cilia- and flagella-associated protein 251-like isoform X1 [Rhinatrema bivittatum]
MLRMRRLPNFSEKDVRLLAKLMKEDERHLFIRPGCMRNQATTDAAWQALSVRFNAQASYPRDVEALKTRARRLRREHRALLLALRIGSRQPDSIFSSTSEDEAVATETEEEEEETEEEAVATEEEEEAVATEEEEEAVATETKEEEAVATEEEEEVVATETEEEAAVATEAEEEEEAAVATEAEEEAAVATEAEEEAAVATEAEEEAAVATEAEEEPEGPPPTQPPPPHSLPISYPVSRSDEEHEEPSSDAPSAVQEQEAASRPSSIEARLDAALARIGRLDRRVEELEGLLGAHLAELVQGQQQIIQLLSAMAGAGSPLVRSRPMPSGPCHSPSDASPRHPGKYI